MILTIVVYAAVILFLTGMLIRVWRMAAMPAHVRWELYPVPGNAVKKAGVMLSEVCLLAGVFKNNRPLWLWSWLFHISIYAMVGAVGLSAAGAVIVQFKEPAELIIAALYWASSCCGIVGASGLVTLRLGSVKLRPYSSNAAIFNLLLLLAIFLTGLAHVLSQENAGRTIVEEAGTLLRLNPAPDLHPASIVHLCLLAFFAAYFPYTQMAHGVLKYFTYHSVLWDDVPARRMSGPGMSRYLAYPIRWIAPHVGPDAKEHTWSEVVCGSNKAEKT